MGYLAKQGKSYQSLDEFNARHANFIAIDAWIKDYNSDSEMTAVMAHNKFSDWSDDERARIGGNGQTSGQSAPAEQETPREEKQDENSNLGYPSAYTLQGSTLLSPVFDSGSCTSAGYAYSYVTAVQTNYAVMNSPAGVTFPPSLSY